MRKYFEEVLPSKIEGYEKREEQIIMAESIKKILDIRKSLIIEAGTGVGKTIGYLLPLCEYSMKNKKRIVVSTYSKVLQKQIYEKDLPILKKIFKDLKYEIIYGMENYICKLRAGEYIDKVSLFKNADSFKELYEFIISAKGTRENAPFYVPDEVWRNINKLRGTCIEDKCPYYNKCYYFKIKKKLKKANIVIVNHHLFFSDIIVNNSLLPETDIVVFDEGHRLEDIIREVFSKKFFLLQFLKQLDEINNIFKYSKFLDLLTKKQLNTKINNIKTKIKKFIKNIKKEFNINNNGILIEKEMQSKIKLKDDLVDVVLKIEEIKKKEKSVKTKEFLKYLISDIEEQIDILDEWQNKNNKKDYFYHIKEEKNNNLIFYITPYSIDKIFSEFVVENHKNVIITSATLSAGDDFLYLKNQLGLQDSFSLQLNSPFNYKKQSILYLETEISSPKEINYKSDIINRLIDIINIFKGNILVLFTNIEFMKNIYTNIKNKIKNIPILIQGELNSLDLIKKFKKKKSILFATNSFWQGIDIKGDDLRCVVITRLPFEVPENPVQKSIYKKLDKEKKNPFLEYSLPKAIFMLKQGFGRLIRSKDDYGAIIILDKRITQASYGYKFLESLPDIKITHSLDEVANFLKEF